MVYKVLRFVKMKNEFHACETNGERTDSNKLKIIRKETHFKSVQHTHFKAPDWLLQTDYFCVSDIN